MIDLILKKFECFNDNEFKFEPKYHKYTYQGNQFTSVTKFIQKFHKPFEQEYWSKVKSEQLGVPQDWLLSEWKQINDYANEVGTDTHQWIELYYKKSWQEIPSNLDTIHRINKFNVIYAKKLHKLEPIKFEVRIFSKKWKIAGMIDALFLYKGKIYIFDWKTNKEITDDNHPKGKYEKLLYPFEEYFKNHLNEYSLQLSLYALILEEWGFEVDGSFIVHIGPGNEDAKLYKAIDMKDKLRNFLNTNEI